MTRFFKTIKNTIKHWYVPAIIGFVFIAIGIYMFSVPLQVYGTLTLLFSLSFLFSGLLELFFSIQNKDEVDGWGWYLAGGVFNSLIGFILLANPSISALVLPFVIGFSLLFKSIQGLGFAFELKNFGNLKWGNLAIASVLGIIFSIILLMNPAFTGISLVVYMALAFIFSGISAIVLSFQLKKIKGLSAKIDKHLNDKIEDLKSEYYNKLDS